MVVATAAGHALGRKADLRLRSRELDPVLEEYAGLPVAQRRGELPDPATATLPRRPVPQPPAGGLIVRGYCTYMKESDEGRIVRAKQYYYERNPDRWAAETQSDTLWLTAAEAASLLPKDPQVGEAHEVPAAIQRRFYSTIGIDYMEGSVNSLKPRRTTMTLTVQRVTPDNVAMRLDGYGEVGAPFDERRKDEPKSRGCALRVLGYVNYNRKQQKFDRFDLAGVGRTWGNKMSYVDREIQRGRYTWLYGIACALVDGDTPAERIPPYNLLHYGSAGPYFE